MNRKGETAVCFIRTWFFSRDHKLVITFFVSALKGALVAGYQAIAINIVSIKRIDTDSDLLFQLIYILLIFFCGELAGVVALNTVLNHRGYHFFRYVLF